VIRALRRCGQEVLVIKVSAGFQIAIPGWMLDPVYCGGLAQEPRPRVSLAALLELLALSRSQHLPGASGAAQKEGTDALKIKGRLLSDQSHPPQEGLVGKVSRTQAHSLPRTGGAVVVLCGIEPNSNPEAK
jgi:hypothetical protein